MQNVSAYQPGDSERRGACRVAERGQRPGRPPSRWLQRCYGQLLGATDGYSGATRKNDDWNRHDRQLDREQRRALERFNRQRSRDYRELGQRRFRSDWARERAYRDLDRQHEARLRDILGDSRYRQEYRRYDNDAPRGYDNPEDAVINLILRELLNR